MLLIYSFKFTFAFLATTGHHLSSCWVWYC